MLTPETNMGQLESPPSFEPNVIQLESIKDSKITSVSVYSNLAEVTRTLKFSVKAGQNQVVISGLPKDLENDSLRVEGKGAGTTIQDVAISSTSPSTQPSLIQQHLGSPDPSSNPVLKALLTRKKIAEQGIHRIDQAISSIETFVSSLTPEHTSATTVFEIIREYEKTVGELHSKKNVLADELEEVTQAIAAEKKKNATASMNSKKGSAKLRVKVTVGIFAEEAVEVELGLIYAVNGASWTPRYDIRVTTAQAKPTFTLTYKADISQSSGEGWHDVALALETATPSYSGTLPALAPWPISVFRAVTPPSATATSAISGLNQLSAATGGGSKNSLLMRGGSFAYGLTSPPPMSMQKAQVSSKGNISATFAVPGLISVPTGDGEHTVTITTLELDANLSWVAIPKMDAKVYLSAKVTNTTEYTLLDGPANVYIDGSFICHSAIGSISPEETFECSLGLDPGIRIVYHPLSKKLSTSSPSSSFTASAILGSGVKTDIYTYTQRITVHNSKPASVQNVKIIDQIPTSEDASISVKLIQPALPAGPAAGRSSLDSKGPVKAAQISTIVASQCDSGEEKEGRRVDFSELGKDGKLNWICSLGAQAKETLTLQWEVTAPRNTAIAGL